LSVTHEDCRQDPEPSALAAQAAVFPGWEVTNGCQADKQMGAPHPLVGSTRQSLVIRCLRRNAGLIAASCEE